MWPEAWWSYLQNECYDLWEWSKCGESSLSFVPTLLWAVGAAALAHRILVALFRRFLFRRVPMWELILQHLLFVWIVIYSVHFWMVLVRVVKMLVDYFYDDMTPQRSEGRKVLQQCAVWACGAAPLAVCIHTRPRPEPSPVMIWITTSPWQRREMGPYGYYLLRPPSTPPAPRPALALRRAFSDSKLGIREPFKKRRYSKSV